MNEDGTNVPAGWTIIQNGTTKVDATAGQDGTKALILNNGDTIVTPMDYAKYRDMNIWMKVYDPDPETNYEIYEAKIAMDARTLNGWYEIGEFDVTNLFDGKTINLSKNIGDNIYYGLRFRINKLPKGDYVVLDNVNFTTGRPARLDLINYSEGGQVDDYRSSNTSYTFNDLDSLSDYYYTVKSHYLFQYSEPTLRRAFGIGAPVLKDASDLTATSYTANWNAVPKATGYKANNYGVYRASADEANHVVLNEDFSKVTSAITDNTDPYNPENAGNTDETALDDYTDYAGWVGVGNTLSQGMVGVAESTSQINYLITPPMYLSNDKKFNLYIKAYGTKGATLLIQTNNKLYATYFEDAGDGTSGKVDNTFIIPDSAKDMEVIFYTLNHEPFILDAVKATQDIMQGNKVYTYLSSKTVDGNTLSCTFDGLDKYSYTDYAFTVISYYDLEGERAVSAMSDYMPAAVITDPVVISNIDDGISGAKEVARYNLNGVRLLTPVKGINIVKLSNGKTVKEIVK
jgi:hypothetical protein